MTPIQKNAAILFADISGSTALYDKLGNKLALQLVTRTLEILTMEVTARQGTLIKTIGDAILCTFPNAADAVNAACAMHSTIEGQSPGGELPIHVRIGLHYGDIIYEGGDTYGDAVNIAARVTALTRARQIMTTRAVVDRLPEKMQKHARSVMRTGFRGKEETFDVYQIVWDPEDTMNTRVGMSAYRKPAEPRHELMLQYHQKLITLNEDTKQAVLGRGQGCDLMIRNILASRQHATIEYNFGKFLLMDHSVNGTYIRFGDDQIIQLNHQQIFLHGAGTISLGQSFSESPTDVIEYILQ
ncbi:adenylate/guanylate cyclase domain-containing protein [Sideroxydans lithotrophicus]|uniref:Adenylate/guanylate cyclase n=1 Tax=Sideroxydans lithotrophicus (strain ES-1) TaxID=580332 RepID=D5CTI6_SIDLE|nr:adenylate/guanylate cyclase domain-containing protein [Sideroxydans lithotrophicus]ADE10292.1 adenylate/guanylate cyclase [Sideroxydans lithotrophicus ES-1]